MAVSAVTASQSCRGAVVLREVSFAFEQSGALLQNITFAVEPGSWTVLMGGVGTGKTTMLRLMAGLLDPTAGSVHLDALGIGFMFQEEGLLPWLSSEANVAMPLRIRGTPPAEGNRRALRTLERVNAAACIGKFPHQLSAGMKKRVELARLVLAGGDLWLLDEPCESLDLPSRLDLLDLLLDQQRAQRSTIVMVSHSLEDTFRVGNRIAILSADHGIIFDRLLPGDTPRPVDDPSMLSMQREIVDLLRADSGNQRRTGET